MTAHVAADLSIADIPADARRLTVVRAELLHWLLDRGMAHERAHDITLAAYEALANCVEHAYNAGRSESDTIALTATGIDADGVVLTITDRGVWQESSGNKLRGRGLPLMRALADAVDVRSTESGTIVRLEWSTPA